MDKADTSPVRPSLHHNVWAPRPADSRLVVLLSDDRRMVEKIVHWVEPLKSTVPCLGEKWCRFHDYPINEKCYAPVAVSRFNYPSCPAERPRECVDDLRTNAWQFRVLEITKGNWWVIVEGNAGQVYHVSRPGQPPNKNVVHMLLQPWRLPAAVTESGFDVEPHLSRMWQRVLHLLRPAEQPGKRFNVS